MRNIFFRREGQIAPFLIAIIVVLIIALMVTANIGKIGMFKTRTANAADAGALAGSTAHSNALNALADTNTAMIAEYLSTQVTFLIPVNICSMGAMRNIAYIAFVAAQTAQFILAWSNAMEGYEEARSAAYQFAFMNAGIDESKERLSGESYESYLQRESRFGQWMKNKGYESGQYTWTDKDGRQNSFTVTVDAPDFPGLIPMPMVMLGLFYSDSIGACSVWCMTCLTDLLKYFVCLMKTLIMGTILLWTTVCCSCTAWAGIGYIVPIAWIAGIAQDNPEISVTTTRVQPEKDLGLWQMKYGSVSSQARARSSGGSVGPAPSPRYDSVLVSGGY